MPRLETRHIARILAHANAFGQEGVRHDPTAQHPTRDVGEAHGKTLVVLQRTDITIVGERQGALIRHRLKGIQVHRALIHLLGGTRVNADFAQGELLDQRQPLRQEFVILQAKAHLDGEVALTQDFATSFQHARQHVFVTQQTRTAPLLCYKGPRATRIEINLTVAQIHHCMQHHAQLTRILANHLGD